MKKYFALLNNGKFRYLGEFKCYSDAYEYAEYDMNIQFLWIYKEATMHTLIKELDLTLKSLNQDVAIATD